MNNNRIALAIPAQAVCNTILQRAFVEKIPVSPMKLQKLLYFTYQTYLKRTGQLLFSERFEAWPYGPVLPSIYDEFKSFHGDPITMFAKNADGSVSVISGTASGACGIVYSIAETWEKYKNKTGIELSGITHQKESAWYKAVKRKDSLLDIDDIREENIA